MADQDLVAIADRWHQDIYLRGRLEVADEICAPDMVARGTGVAADAPTGPAFVREDAAGFREAFDIESLTNDDIVAAGDRVVIRWSMRGRHVGPFLGVDGTGRRVTASGIDIFRLERGRIVEFWGEFNLLDLAQQIGAVTTEVTVV